MSIWNKYGYGAQKPTKNNNKQRSYSADKKKTCKICGAKTDGPICASCSAFLTRMKKNERKGKQ